MKTEALTWKITRLIETPEVPEGANGAIMWKRTNTPATFGQLIASELVNKQTNSTEGAVGITDLADRILKSRYSSIEVNEDEKHVLDLILKSLTAPSWLKAQLNENLLKSEVPTLKAVKKEAKLNANKTNTTSPKSTS